MQAFACEATEILACQPITRTMLRWVKNRELGIGQQASSAVQSVGFSEVPAVPHFRSMPAPDPVLDSKEIS
jgi:hypothetical protein